MNLVKINMNCIGDYKHSILLILFFIFTYSATFSQQTGELENVEIEIVKERKLQVPNAERKFSKVAPQASDPIYPPITYSFSQTQISLPELNLPIRPLKLKKDEFNTSHNAYLRLGMGNFLSPYGELYYTNKKQEKGKIAANAWFDIFDRGPVQKAKSGNGNYGLRLNGSLHQKRITLLSEVDYQQSFWHFYGNPNVADISKNDLRQSFNRFNLSAGFITTENKKSTFSGQAKFQFMSDRLDADETILNFQIAHLYQLKDNNTIETKFEQFIINREDVAIDAKARNLTSLQSIYTFSLFPELTLSAGAGIALENDTIDNKEFHFYPKATATYQLSKQVRIKGYLDGNLKPVTLNSISLENPWLAPNISIAHTNEALVLGAQIESTIAKKVDAQAGFSVTSIKNLYFFNQSQSQQEKFVAQFDKGATERTNFYLQLQYAASTRTWFTIRYDGFSYNTDTLARAWHRPSTVLQTTASHLIGNKLRISADFNFLGGLRAQNPQNESIVALPNVVDLSTKVDYFLREKMIVTLQLANILNQDYQQYQFYNVRGFQVRAGFTWSF